MNDSLKESIAWVGGELRTMARSFRDLADASRARNDSREVRHRTRRAKDCDAVADLLSAFEAGKVPTPRGPRFYFSVVSVEGIRATLAHDDREVLERHARAYGIAYSALCRSRGLDEAISIEIVDREAVQ